MSALSELLAQANGGRFSARSLARAAQHAGFSLNHDTAARYLRGDHGRPDERTLQALSSVLRVPLGKLRSAAALPTGETEPYRPPAEASRLSRRQRRAVDEIIRAMLDDRSATATVITTRRPRSAGRQPTSRAARRGTVEPSV